jgi:hypothetical protein
MHDANCVGYAKVPLIARGKMASANIATNGTIWAMRQSEPDKINEVLDLAQCAIQQIQNKVDELASTRAAAQTPEKIAAVDFVAGELLLQLRKISDAIHTTNPAPYLRLVSDAE